MLNHIEDILTIGQKCTERFIDSAVLAEIEELDVRLAGCSNLSGEYKVARTFPLEHTLFYTVSGAGKLVTNQKEWALKPNTLAILPAKQGFCVSIDAAHWDIIWLNLANNKRWQHLCLSEASVLDDQKLAPLHFAMELLYSEPSAKLREGALPILRHYLGDAQLHIQAVPTHPRINALFEDIEKRLQFDWNIMEMSQHAHYSPPHLHRLCKMRFGRSPMQQLIFLRIERAQKLLLSTQWPISHIASYVGYANIFNFSKRFKKSVGISPSEFRRSN